MEKQATTKIQMQNERLHLRSPSVNICFKMEIMGGFSENAFFHAIESVCKRL